MGWGVWDGVIDLFWINVNLNDTFKTQMKQDKRSFCVTISRREKDGAKTMISYMYLMVYLIMVDKHEFQLKCWCLCFFVFFVCKT